ncbi:MAG: hypothetical protein NC548_06300 [Lachnospiraceae bacterium]|nr:hypothetical protein [Lachnospiraceae bacterium]
MNHNDALLAKRFVKRLSDLATDESGTQAYRNYADKLLQDISGLEHVATIVLSHKTPGVAALRLINHPRSKALAKMLFNEQDVKVLDELVIMAYMAKQIALKGKRQVTKDDVKTYKYLAKAYKKAVNALKEKYGYDVSTKKHVKERFSAVRGLINGDDDFGFDEDLFDDDDELDLDLDGDDSDDGFDDMFGDEESNADNRIPVDELLEELRQHGYKIIPPAQPAGLPKNYNPMAMPEVNFDFTGKATLEIISDRLLAIAEGLQLVLNRIYGREIKLIDQPQEQQAMDLGGIDLRKLTPKQMIYLYNMLGRAFGGDSSPLDFDPDDDDPDDGDFGPPGPGVRSTDLDSQLEALRQGMNSADPKVINIGMHVESTTSVTEEPTDSADEKTEEPPPPPAPDLVDNTDEEPETPSEKKGPTVADQFNGKVT